MVFDPSYHELDAEKFQRQNWSHTVYGEPPPPDRPPNMTKPRGQGLIVSAYVDSDHTGDTVTRRSRTVFYLLQQRPCLSDVQ